jgi:predicted ATPase
MVISATQPDMFRSAVGERERHSTHYLVSGFRSLQDFEICLEQGLNVFLGVNGAGKTNFIDFLDFLSTLLRSGGSAAVSSSGGISRVFSQEALKRKIPRVTARVQGITDLRPFMRIRSKSRRTLFKFEYEVDIRYSKFHTAVFIAGERIKFKGLHSSLSADDADNTVGTIEVKRRSPLDDDELRWIVGPYLTSKSARNPLRHSNRLRVPAASVEDDAALLLESPHLGADESLFGMRPSWPAVTAVRYALSRGRSFNLVPHQARTPDDISKPPQIEADGSGLSATIYHMQQAEKSQTQRSTSRNVRFPPGALARVVSWTQLVIPELTDITATADPHTGKYLVYLVVEAGDQNLRIPLQSASDGTLKWLSFVCLIVTQGSAYTFEEPENYLHPKMQRFLVELIREKIEEDVLPGHFILSTHSETIINQCKPGELFLFKFIEGKTVSSRLKNPLSVEQQVNETGFGLGYYYAANAVS